MNCFGKRRYAELKQFPGAISAAAYPPSLRCSMHGVLGLGAQRQPPGQANWPNAFALRAWVVGIDGLGHPYIRSISSIAKATDTAYHRQTSNACRLVFIQMQHEMGWGKAHQAADGVCLGLAGEDGIHVGATGWIMFARNSSNVT